MAGVIYNLYRHRIYQKCVLKKNENYNSCPADTILCILDNLLALKIYGQVPYKQKLDFQCQKS